MEPQTFIDANKINKLLAENHKPDKSRVGDILARAMQLKGLVIADVSYLLNIQKKELLEALFEAAHNIKDEIYGKRLVLFSPLYISNFCSNNCLYCGFRTDNKGMKRRILSIDEIKEETKYVLEQGHKRILMLMGEDHSSCSIDYFVEAIEAVYSVRDSKGSNIRRINVEIAPLTDEEFSILKEVKIGTYTVFQETYNYDTYKIMHPKGKKSDYFWRLNAMDRALEKGMNDVGIGALFGLYDYRFEVMALVEHARHLDNKYNIGPHTISIPRIKPAEGAPASIDVPHRVSDEDFRKLVAILRCAVPYTGMILSTRESAELRNELFEIGISQISAGSRTSPGGYKQAFDKDYEAGQFSINDCRSSGEVIHDVIKQGYIPSFCTACYRLDRVGEDFMDLAKPGLIKLNCLPNALTTLKEYLLDYADDDTKQLGERIIEKELKNIPTNSRRLATIKYLKRIEDGERDLYF